MCAHQEEKAFIPCQAKPRDPESLSKLQTGGDRCRELRLLSVSSFNFLLIGACSPDPGAEEYQLRSGCFLKSAQFKEYLSFFFSLNSVWLFTKHMRWPNEFILASEVLPLQRRLLRKYAKCS